MSHCKLFLSFLVTLAVITQAIHAVEYDITNTAPTTPGGIRFTNEIGVDFTRQTLTSATDFIWRLFQQNTEADRKNVARVSLIIGDINGIAFAVPARNEIQVGVNYIGNITGDIKWDISGVLYHEMAHIWQWSGPSGLIEGIADFVRLKAGYIPGHWVKPGGGDRWDQGYDVTARFLDYCNGLRNGFVAELNKKMRNAYSVNFFVELLGKTVEQLWSDYKAQYAK